VLTFNGRYDDRDKDGFLETRLGEVNPTGYVVMHFRAREGNVRIGFWDLLAVDAPEPLPLATGGCRDDGSQAAGSGGNDPGPQIPEPASVALLGLGGALAMLRRHRRRLVLQP
jgi:hypothetical protein